MRSVWTGHKNQGKSGCLMVAPFAVVILTLALRRKKAKR